MIAIHEKKIQTLIGYYKTEIDKQAKNIKIKLEELRDNATNRDELRYIRLLLRTGDKLISGSLAELEQLAIDLDRILIIDTTIQSHRDFRESILTALGYKQRRADFYPLYFQQIGIKSCVYCNAQLCVTVEDEGGNPVAKFQVDHHIPKDNYPGLSVALFNLIPSCASCNNKKGVKNIDFHLYTDGANTRKSPYRFEIVDKNKTVAKYIASRNPKDIRINFHEPPTPAGTHRLNELFAIKGIYDTQIDIVEELILKAHIYDDSFKKELMDNFGDLFKDENSLNRLIIGNYTEEVRIHHRPLAKFVQDIAKDLELI